MQAFYPARFASFFFCAISVSLCHAADSNSTEALADTAETKLAKGLGDVGTLQRIEISTGRETEKGLILYGSEDQQQLLVTGYYSSGLARDLTRDVELVVQPADVAGVDSLGIVSPHNDGQATLLARHTSGIAGSIQLQIHGFDDNRAVNFTNQIVPIFTKLNCNGGGCHGKSGGQNGFRLSLLGFEPKEDFEYLVHEAYGRRVSTASPEHSLLLQKATGLQPHGGGERMKVGDPSYNLIERWITEGAEFGGPEAAKVASVKVFPKNRLMGKGDRQQLVVIATYTDGTKEDVSSMAQYEANVSEMAEVGNRGLVQIHNQSGDVAVMVRYQSHVDVFRATIPLGAPIEKMPASRGFIDDLVFAKLNLLGLPPSEICDDSSFLRRVTLDVAGRLPTAEEVETFLADDASEKRNRWIDTLLESEDYSYYFANKWSSILRNKRQNAEYRHGTFAFHHWIRESLDQNVAYNDFVRGIVAASGDIGQNPPVAWYREVNETNEQVEDTAQLFLGLRIQCARCHHHPFEKWSRHDYYSFSAFFSRLGKKAGDRAKETRVFHKRGDASAVNPKNNQPVKPAGFGAEPLAIAPEDDPRHALVDWMSSPDNKFFAPMLVNRYWKHFFGRGLVDPEDDMRATNPSTNPELLKALANDFVESGFDLKHLVRTITRSSVYQLSSTPNDFNVKDKQNFSRYYPRRLPAEVLLDSIDQVTGAHTAFEGMPVGTKAVQLPDAGFNNYFLKVFGRPEGASACECERSTDANLAQSLHLINSSEIHNRLSGDTGTAAKLAAETEAAPPQRLRQLYLSALGRPPTKDETAKLMDYLERKAQPADKGGMRPAYEDIVWTLINTKEFLFNH